MVYKNIANYTSERDELIRIGGTNNELNIRPAFQNLLSEYAKKHKLTLVPELPYNGVIPDGTIKDSLRMPHGYWEAKDTNDNLDNEIRNKTNKGYPTNNIMYEDSHTVVLIQEGREKLRTTTDKPKQFNELLECFFNYEALHIRGFRAASEQFKNDLPEVLKNLRDTIIDSEEKNQTFCKALKRFHKECKGTISPNITLDDIREMLLQHILTKDIFNKVFSDDQFHKENNIATRLNELEETFFKRQVRRDALNKLQAYYGAIGRAASEVANYGEKQQFLKKIYEDFYAAYNPKAADRLGIIYTPNEIVDFIIRNTDILLQRHFGISLADKNVNILDPATGTGTFITDLLNYLPVESLEYKYKEEIMANELSILPYYIANLNIEYTYYERTGQYLEFPGICLVDTLDNMQWQPQGATSVKIQAEMNIGGISTENWIRVQDQNDKVITLILGNPPYNTGQRNANENNKNQSYPEIDKRIKETYVKGSTAQKTQQYDMYKRFIRWASDRLGEDGIVAFITNRSYIDSKNDDGFRKIIVDEFTDLYIVDLGGDVRANGNVGNVFGIMTGVAIGFFVRNSSKNKDTKANIHYAYVDDSLAGQEKLNFLTVNNIYTIEFENITPDSKHNWLNQSNSDFYSLIPLIDKETKLTKSDKMENSIFKLYSRGITTGRDEWTFDFNKNTVSDKMYYFCRVYQKELERFALEKPDVNSIGNWVDRTIKWTTELEQYLIRNSTINFSTQRIIDTIYKPYVFKYHYYDFIITHRRYQMPRIFPDNIKHNNKVICFSGKASSKSFQTLATNTLPDLHILENTQCLPLYRYTENGKCVDNITNWGLIQFREHYNNENITPEDIFAYVYAVFHNPEYRQKYEIDLKQDFPRIPLYDDFDKWAIIGNELLDLHINFETVEPYGLKLVETTDKLLPTPILKADKEKGIIRLDSNTQLIGVPKEAWEYQLGQRSALEWVLNQYQEKKVKDPTIKEKFDTYRFADYKEQVIDLLQRVCTVSVKTMALISDMNDM